MESTEKLHPQLNRFLPLTVPNSPDFGIMTFFDKQFTDFNDTNITIPYSYRLKSIIKNLTPQEQDEYGVEYCIFEQMLEHEHWLYEPRRQLVGNIEIFNHSSLIYNGSYDSSYSIPCWSEDDYCRFGCCTAESIIVTTEFGVFELLKQSALREHINAIYILTSGIPRFAVRRFIRRLKDNTRLPVFFLSDNDLWSYFSYSILLRGCLDPRQFFDFNAIPDCYFIGINAFQSENFVRNGCPKRNWKVSWTKRINSLKQYDCFSTQEWQNEFKQFIVNGYAVDLTKV